MRYEDEINDPNQLQMWKEATKDAWPGEVFVKEIVPLVDLKAGRIEISPPPGLLEINLSRMSG